MPAPTERPETDATNSPSARSDVDETVAAAGASGASAVPGFGPPAAGGEVGSLGPYRLVKELGRGGMGAVYAAIDTRLERPLALKVMLPQFAADASAKERFLREARAAARIKHDNVVTVYEADERNGVPYIAMEFLEGYPLDEYLKKKGLPTVAQVLRIAAETAAGLAAAHKIGLVHRDIKPANLWLEVPHGRVKVLDFGLAKPVDSEFELTKSGAVVGTPAYMSPEQARGEKVDARTDLFSLGSVLYRLCTGKLPFSGPTTMAVLMALGIDEPPPVRDVNPAVPEALAALIHQLLSKQADARPQSAAEVVKRVRAIAAELAALRGPSPDLSASHPQVMQPQVVYAVMPVTAAPEANPFADLDAPSAAVTSRESAEPAARAAPAAPAAPAPKKSSGRMLWAAVGAVVLAVVAVGAVIIATKKKDNNEAKTDPPVVPSGKTPNQVGLGGKNSVANADADRKAAEWVIAQGGSVRVNGEMKDIKAAAELPKERVALTVVNLANTKVSDAGLVSLKDLKSLTELDLHGTPVTAEGLANLKHCKGLTGLSLIGTPLTDEGLASFKDCKNLAKIALSGTTITGTGLVNFKDCQELTHLYLDNTQVVDAGLEHLKGCKGLIVLSVAGSQVTDAGLIHLTQLKGLAHLDARRTKVTAKGAAAFHAAVPGCKIDHDGVVIEAVDVDRKAAEWVIAQGGFLWVNGVEKSIRVATDLPKDRFNLTDVDLAGTKVSDTTLAQLKELKNLKSLDLKGTAVSDAGLIHLKELKSLKRLLIQQTTVTPKGAAELAAVLLGCRIVHDGGIIEAIDVDRNAAAWVIGQGGAVHVNRVVKDIKTAAELPKDRFTLTGVNLANTKASDAGLVSLKDLKSLTELDLHGTPVTDAGLLHLKELKSLTGLHLRGTKVTDVGLAHLRELNSLKSLTLTGTPVSDAGLVSLKDLKSLTELDLTGTPVSDAGLPHLKELKGLTWLVLSGTPVSDAGLAHLTQCKGLTYLDVRKTAVSAKGLEALRAALPACKITHDGGAIGPKVGADPNCKAAEYVLSIGGSVRVSGKGSEVQAAADLPKDRYTLTGVNLFKNTAVTDAGLAHLKDCKGLKTLRLAVTGVSDAGLEHLKNLTSLTHLWLGQTKVSDAGLAHLKGYTELTELYLGGTGVSDAGLAHLTGCKGLTVFHLNDTKVTDAGLAHFKGYQTLTVLYLSGTPVTHAGLEHFKGCKGLTVLHLAGTGLTDAGLETLAGFANLTGLDVRRTKLTPEGVKRLAKALPGCQITHDGGVIEPKK